MLITKKKQVMIEKTIITKVICNRCGKEVKFENGMMIDDELHDISVQFGYYSNRDGEYWNFHLCEDCLVEITKDFKYKPNIGRYL